jgi:hypothetical protein
LCGREVRKELIRNSAQIQPRQIISFKITELYSNSSGPSL